MEEVTSLAIAPIPSVGRYSYLMKPRWIGIEALFCRATPITSQAEPSCLGFLP